LSVFNYSHTKEIFKRWSKVIISWIGRVHINEEEWVEKQDAKTFVSKSALISEKY